MVGPKESNEPLLLNPQMKVIALSPICSPYLPLVYFFEHELGTYFMLIDSHCHLNFNTFDDDRADVVERAKAEDIAAFINPGTNLADSRQVVNLADQFPDVYAAVGVHPNDADGVDEAVLSQLRELADHPKVVAIGEIGLDYYWDEAPRPVQQRVFEQQLELAKELNLPVIIHQRDSAADTMDVLRQWGGSQHPGLVLHSFSGDQAMADEAIDLGFYIGISGPVTFKNARDLPGIVVSLPPERILVETDAPFLSPHPYRGKRNEPARVKLVAGKVAELQSMSLEEMCQQLTKNTITLFKLPMEKGFQ
jgi:TatD DNase family protein